MKCRLKEILARKGVKSSWLAEQVGITKANLSNISTGRTEPKLSTAFKIAEALGVSIYEIWTNEE